MGGAGGELTVVVAAGEGGVLLHESSGHGMEADAVARNASAYHGRQGQRIGVAGFNAGDDATVEGAWGSFQFDDEGTPRSAPCCSRAACAPGS